MEWVLALQTLTNVSAVFEVGFSQSVYQIVEGENTFVCVEALSGLLTQNVYLLLQTRNSSLVEGIGDNVLNNDAKILISALAIPSRDYEPIIQEVVFEPNTSSVCVPIVVVNDRYLESEERFDVVLSQAMGESSAVSFSPKMASVVILDDPEDGTWNYHCIV